MPAPSSRPVLHPISDHCDPRELQDLPNEAREALSVINISFSDDEPSACMARLSWAGDWWFTLIEGRGVMRTNVRVNTSPIRPSPIRDYALLAVSLGGRNRPSGKLGYWPPPGEMALMPWVAPSDIITVGEFRYLIAHIPIDALKAAAGDRVTVNFGRRLSFYHGSSAALYAALRGLASEAGNANARDSLALILPDIASLIVRVFDQPEQPGLASRDSHHDHCAQVESYLEAHLNDPFLAAGAIAAACGLSRRQLFRLFEGRESFTSVLRRLRIEKARDLLVLHPTFPIAEVARLVGFSSGAHFSNVFHAHNGCSPQKYRARELLAAASN